MSLSAVQKAEVVKEHGRGERDTGSPEVQVALLSRRIAHLTGHFRQHAHDRRARLAPLMRPPMSPSVDDDIDSVVVPTQIIP